MAEQLPMMPPPPVPIEDEEEYPLQFPTKEQEVAFKQQVEEWYKQYGEIYTSEVNEIIFVFRGLTPAELKRANKLYKDTLERAEYICRLCVLEPQVEDYSLEIYAGIPEALCRLVLEESGFTTDAGKINTLLFQFENEMNEVSNRIPCIIKEVFQDIPFEEIENWPLEKTLYYYTRAKWTLENLRGVQLVSEDEAQG